MRKKIFRYVYNGAIFCQIDRNNYSDLLKIFYDFLKNDEKNIDPSLNIYESYTILTKYDM